MTVVTKPIVTAQYAPVAQTTVYTTPASTRTIIDKFTGYNGTASSATLAVNLVPAAGTAAATNLIVSRALQAGETYTFPELVGHVMDPAGLISLIAGTASAIVIRISGREIT